MSSKLISSTLAIALLSSLNAYSAELEGSIAIGAMNEASPFKGVSSESMPIIAPNIEYGDFYWQAVEFGYEIFDNDQFEIAAVFRPFEGFDVEAKDMAEGYKGIEDRDGEFEYGFTAGIALGNYDLEITPLYNGEGASLEVGLERVWFGLNHTIMVQGFARYDSADYQDYYYGVTEVEAAHELNTAIDAAYKADSGISYGLQVIAQYDINEKWYVLGMAEYTKLDSSIEDSPIVDSSSVAQFALGVGYKF